MIENFISNIVNIMERVNYFIGYCLYNVDYSYYQNPSTVFTVDALSQCIVVNLTSLCFIVLVITFFYKSLKWLFNLFGG